MRRSRKTEGVRRSPPGGRIGPVDQFEQRTPGAIAKGRTSHAPQSSFLRKQEPRGCKGSALNPGLPALRYAPSGMTTVGLNKAHQRVRSFNIAPPSLPLIPTKVGTQSIRRDVCHTPAKPHPITGAALMRPSPPCGERVGCGGLLNGKFHGRLSSISPAAPPPTPTPPHKGEGGALKPHRAQPVHPTRATPSPGCAPFLISP